MKNISDKVKLAMERKLRKGEWPNKAPFGYKNIIKQNGCVDIVVDAYTGHMVKKVFELYSTGAFSVKSLCEKIEAEHGINLTRYCMANILGNPFYHGVMIIKNKEYAHRYLPLISKFLFDQAQEVTSTFKKKMFRYSEKYIYQGLLSCAHCGMSITAERHKGFVYYHCTQHRGKHGAKWIREEKITEQIGEAFKKLQLPVDVIESVTASLNDVNQDKFEFHSEEFEKLVSERRILEKTIDNLYLDRLHQRITENNYDKFYQSLKEKITEISDRIEHLKKEESDYYLSAKYVLDVMNRAHEIFVISEVEVKRQLVQLLLSNLRLNGETIVWEVHKPFDLFLNLTTSA